MKMICSFLLIIVISFVSCKKNVQERIFSEEQTNIIHNNILEDVNEQQDTKPNKEKHPFDTINLTEIELKYYDDKYVVFFEDYFIRFVYKNNGKYNISDYEKDKPIFTFEGNNFLAFFDKIINDVLIIICGSTTNPLPIYLINLNNGDIITNGEYRFRIGYVGYGGYSRYGEPWNTDYIVLLKWIGYENTLTEEQKKQIDIEIFEYELKYEKMKLFEGDRLGYFQKYIFNFNTLELRKENKIIAVSFE
jgi:hypothetical protein